MRLSAVCIWAAVAVAGFSISFTGQASNLVVTNTADSGPGTLRATLAQAQGGDVITFDVAGVITNSSAELVISNDVSIIGPGPSALSVAGTNWGPRIFQVRTGVTAIISGLTIRDSYAGLSYTGGGIFNAGNLILTNCVFSNCRSLLGGSAADPAPNGVHGGTGYDGGAIYNAGTLVVMNCDFLGNTASAGGFGLAGPNGYGGDGGNGGAIYNAGTLLATNCNFLTNSAASGGSGGSGYYAPVGGGSPHGSAGGNGGDGGAIYATGPATFVNCSFGNNTAGAGGTPGNGLGGSSTRPTGGNGGHGGTGGDGGAIFSLNQLTLISCTFFNNHGGTGSGGGAAGGAYAGMGGTGGYGGNGGSGAVYCTGTGQITACSFMSNGGGNAGGGGKGGASTGGYPGGTGGYGGRGGSGAAIYSTNTSPWMTLQNTILCYENAGFGAGGGAGGSGIVTGTAGTNGLNGTGPDLFGTFTSLGHNFVQHGAGSQGLTNGINNDQVDPAISLSLGALSRNGGPVLTCAFPSATIKQLVDAGDDSLVTGPLNITTDARGFPRLSGSHVDIGAYELQYPTLPITVTGSVSNGTMFVTFTNVPGMYRGSVMRKSALEDGWAAVGTPVEISPGVFQWDDTTFPDNPQQVYKVRWP